MSLSSGKNSLRPSILPSPVPLVLAGLQPFSPKSHLIQPYLILQVYHNRAGVLAFPGQNCLLPQPPNLRNLSQVLI
ncbi:hypothetical protein BDZ91DRAFT_34125 [Kalaharituber pfeilii]|nr:hypothetical protein BDZ91DRAFT_34125 [Kalaharituber pfeilii]